MGWMVAYKLIIDKVSLLHLFSIEFEAINVKDVSHHTVGQVIFSHFEFIVS